MVCDRLQTVTPHSEGWILWLASVQATQQHLAPLWRSMSSWFGNQPKIQSTSSLWCLLCVFVCLRCVCVCSWSHTYPCFMADVQLWHRNHSTSIYCNYCQASGGPPLPARWPIPIHPAKMAALWPLSWFSPQSANGTGQVCVWAGGKQRDTSGWGINILPKGCWLCSWSPIKSLSSSLYAAQTVSVLLPWSGYW